jgi:hypothetical protein
MSKIIRTVRQYSDKEDIIEIRVLHGGDHYVIKQDGDYIQLYRPFLADFINALLPDEYEVIDRRVKDE